MPDGTLRNLPDIVTHIRFGTEVDFDDQRMDIALALRVCISQRDWLNEKLDQARTALADARARIQELEYDTDY